MNEHVEYDSAGYPHKVKSEAVGQPPEAQPHVCKPSCHNPCLLNDERSRPLVDSPNSRRRPLAFESREEAEQYAKASGLKVWAKVWSWAGVFEFYPGGRSVWHKNW
jgi:hypothetical protein